MSSLGDLPFLDVDTADFYREQLQVLARARETSWIHRSRRGIEVLSYEPQWSLLRDRRLGQDQARTAQDSNLQHPDVLRFRGEFLNSTRGQTHARLRSTVAPFFAKAYVENLRTTIRGLIDTLLDDLTAGSTVDLFTLVCEPTPGLTYAHLVRAPDADEPFITRMSESILKLVERDPKNGDMIESAYLELFDYTEERFALVEQEPGDDLITHLLSAVDDGKLTRREAMDLSILLLEASTDNTTHQMALVMSVLLDNPSQWDEITADQSLIPRAVEEAIRIMPRVLANERTAFEGFDWLGFHVPAGTQFVLSTLAANRDPATYPNPDVFDMHRSDPPMTTMFGSGMHACLGMNLARVEIQEFVAAIATRFPTIKPTGPATWRLTEFVTESQGLTVVRA